MNVAIERIRNVELPQYATPGSAAFDLAIGDFLSGPDFAPAGNPCDAPIGLSRTVLGPNLQLWVGTGLRMQLPDGFGLAILPRSGLGAKRGLVIGNLVGVGDSDYRSEIKLALWNRSDMGIALERGDRVAQGWILPAPQARFHEVECIEETGRGGFGSTG